MSTRLTLRRTALAALTAMAGFGAQAIEATQWDPQHEALQLASADATAAPSAWSALDREATQFRDARSQDAMASRAAVRGELQQARTHGLLNDTGEAGASERVLAQREAFVAAESERLMALNAQTPDDDPIAAIADAAMNDNLWDSEAPAGLAAELERDAPLPHESSVTTTARAPLSEQEPLPAEAAAG